MANSKRKCTHCKDRYPTEQGIKTPAGWFCCIEHAKEYAISKRKRDRQRELNKAKRIQAERERAEREAHRERKKSVKKISAWQQQLRSLVQQYVMTVKDKDAKCSTCGNQVATEAGHYLSVGSRIELQFELTNIHPQCHECNVYKSGNRAEYDKFILEKYGQAHFDKLNSHDWPTLKEAFPTWREYEAEIKRYRKLLRDNGVKPRI